MVFYRLLEEPLLLHGESANRLHLQMTHAERTLDIWVLGLIVAGSIGLCIGDEQGTTETGQYYLMPPHVRHYGTYESDFTVVYFHFKASCENCEPHEAGALPVFGNIPAHLRISDWFDSLRCAADFGLLDENGWNLQLRALLDQLHFGARSSNALNPTERLVVSTLDYLRAHVQQPLSQAHLSNTLGYSYDHLDRLFRNRFGLTIFRRHNELRFDYAVALLQAGHSLKETARAIGFEDYYHFLKAFKRERGCSPGQFLKQLR